MCSLEDLESLDGGKREHILYAVCLLYRMCSLKNLESLDGGKQHEVLLERCRRQKLLYLYAREPCFSDKRGLYSMTKEAYF